MEFTIGELIDRTSINLLKVERLGDAQARVSSAEGLRELDRIEAKLKRWRAIKPLSLFLDLLKTINGFVWDRDKFVRTVTEGELDRTEKILIAHYAIDSRDFNRVRKMVVEIVDELFGEEGK